MKNNVVNENNSEIVFKDIKALILNTRKKVYTQVNTEMLNLYWNIGKIIMNIQNGQKRASYGKETLKELSLKLVEEFGNGFSKRNLERMRMFYKLFPIATTLPSQLTWSHYVELIKIKDEEERNYYLNECISCNWSVRELQRQTKTFTYDRLITKNYKTNKLVTESNEFIKNPYILEFLNLENDKFSEKDLEKEILEHLKEFLLELGKGYMFVGNQKRITIEKNNYYPDLVFYNNIFKSYFIIDLKMGKLAHKDLGQMQMYVNYFDKEIKNEGENNTIGLLLCKDKNKTVIKYTLNGNENIYASKYMLHLPSKEELIKIVEDV